MIRSLDLRLAFLKTFDKTEIHNLSVLLEGAIGRSTQPPLGESVRHYLSFELLYCLKRHEPWLANPLFQHLLTHHIANDFKISLASSESMLATILKAKEKAHSANPDSLEERNFLLYLIVAVLNCRNPDLINDEIGLGSALLRLIQDSLKASGSEDIANFAPTLTYQSLNVLHELAEEYRKSPSITSVYQIYFGLIAKVQDIPISDKKQLAHDLLEVLLHLGTRKHLSHLEFREKLDATRNHLGEHWEKLLEFLKHDAYVFEPNPSRLQLTWLGYELTAGAFTLRHPKEKLLSTQFYGLHPTWQEALISAWPSENLANLWASIELGHYLAPRSVDAIHERFKYIEGTTGWRDWLAKTAGSAVSPQVSGFTEGPKAASSSTKNQTFGL